MAMKVYQNFRVDNLALLQAKSIDSLVQRRAKIQIKQSKLYMLVYLLYLFIYKKNMNLANVDWLSTWKQQSN